MSGLILPPSYRKAHWEKEHRAVLNNLNDVLARSCKKRGWAQPDIKKFVEEVMDQASELDRLSKDDIIACLKVKMDNRERQLIAAGKMVMRGMTDS